MLTLLLEAELILPMDVRRRAQQRVSLRDEVLELNGALASVLVALSWLLSTSQMRASWCLSDRTALVKVFSQCLIESPHS